VTATPPLPSRKIKRVRTFQFGPFDSVSRCARPRDSWLGGSPVEAARHPFPTNLGNVSPAYCTVSMTLAECVIDPEVAVIIMVVVPRGVPLPLLLL